MTIWKKSETHPRYEISTCGRVRNLETGRELFGSLRNDGYVAMTLGRGKSALLHNLVLETFVGPRPTGCLGRHLNDVKSDNHLSNLAWGTHAENSADAVANARKNGKLQANAKLTTKQVLDICKCIDDGEKFAEIGARYGITAGAVTHINTGVVWAWLTGRSSANKRPGTHRVHARKLTEEKVLAIVKSAEEGLSQRKIAALYQIRHQTVGNILKGKIWSHVTGRA